VKIFKTYRVAVKHDHGADGMALSLNQFNGHPSLDLPYFYQGPNADQGDRRIEWKDVEVGDELVLVRKKDLL
jgi:hypothetical protein